MELLLALDLVTLPEAKEVLREVCDCIDIVEIGTPFVIREGIGAVTEIKREFPALRTMADLKIMDAGEYEAGIAFEAGADIVTVLGVAHDSTIRAAAGQARRYGKSVMVDMIGVASVETRAREVDSLGADYLCVHTAFDLQHSGGSPLAELRMVKEVVQRTGIAVAGGINLSTIDDIVRAGPQIVIVGAGITGEANKRETARAIKSRIESRRE